MKLKILVRLIGFFNGQIVSLSAGGEHKKITVCVVKIIPEDSVTR